MQMLRPRIIAVALCAALVLLAPGVAPYEALAANVSARGAGGRPFAIPLAPQPQLGMPPLAAPTIAAPLFAAPSIAAIAAPAAAVQGDAFYLRIDAARESPEARTAAIVKAEIASWNHPIDGLDLPRVAGNNVERPERLARAAARPAVASKLWQRSAAVVPAAAAVIATIAVPALAPTLLLTVRSVSSPSTPGR